MPINLNQFTGQGSRYEFWSIKSGVYPYGTTGTIANGADDGMGRLKLLRDFNLAEPQATSNPIQGDNGASGSFLVSSADAYTGDQVVGAFDQTFATKATGRTIVAYDDHDISVVNQGCYTYADMAFVINSPAKSQEAGSVGESGWDVIEFFAVTAQPLTPARTFQTNFDYQAILTLNLTDTFLWGETLATGGFTLTEAYHTDPIWSEYPVTYHTFIGDGAATTVTLDETPAAASGAKVQYWLDGVKKTYTTDYTVVTSTKILTFVAAPGAGEVAIIRYQFVPGC
jgi:hypothetical protein